MNDHTPTNNLDVVALITRLAELIIARVMQ